MTTRTPEQNAPIPRAYRSSFRHSPPRGRRQETQALATVVGFGMGTLCQLIASSGNKSAAAGRRRGARLVRLRRRAEQESDDVISRRRRRTCTAAPALGPRRATPPTGPRNKRSASLLRRDVGTEVFVIPWPKTGARARPGRAAGNVDYVP